MTHPKKKRSKPSKSLLEFFKNSPSQEINLERSRDIGRKVNLKKI